MSPHSNILILFILLEYSTFTRFILADDGHSQFEKRVEPNKNEEPDNNFLPVPQNRIGPTPPTDNLGVLPEFPQRPDSVYFVVAVAGGAKVWGRTLARALLDMGHPFTSPQGPPLRPLYIDLPPHGRFSANVLMQLCHRIDAQPLAGMIVIGYGQAARAVALAGNSMNIPVLWAKGGTANLKDGNRELTSRFQALLQPSSHEILEAIRALFLQTHWHSFFVLSDVYSTMVLARRNGGPLKEAPLVPTILPLPANDDQIFRQLAQISRSTRGVVLLLCNIDVARKVMHEAQRLNMIGGHFIWIWADTSSTTEFYNAAYHDVSEVIKDTKDLLDRSEYSSKKTDTGSDSTYDRIREMLERKMDIDEVSPRRKSADNSEKLLNRFGLNMKMNLNENDKPIVGMKKRDIEIDDSLNQKSNESIDNFFINNLNTDLNLDDYLVDNNNVDIDVKSKRKSNNKPSNDTSSYVLFHHFVDFPVGLLALRPVHMNVDRHFIRSAVRLFASSWAKIENENKSSSNRARGGSGASASSSSSSSTIGNRNKFNQKFKRNAQNQLHSRDGGDAVIVNKYQKSKIIKNSTFQVNSSFLKSSDLTNNNNNDKINGSFNQILSGLNENSNNNMSNNNKPRVKKDILSKNVNKRRGSWWQVMNVTDARDYQLSNRRTPRYRGGCYGSQTKEEIASAEYFARLLAENTQRALAGQKLLDGYSEKALTIHFDLLNLVPDNNRKSLKSFYNQQQFDGMPPPTPINEFPTKWRRVGTVSGHHVHLDTIVWPGGDIVVSGLSARARSVFRVVTALSPPFVMESELDEDGLCLRGLPCHRLSPKGRQNLTLMFNAIETRDRLEEDAVEHGKELPAEEEQAKDKVDHLTKCCYGLSMDILDNIATELGFEFHLYIVQDELFGGKHKASKHFYSRSKETNDFLSKSQKNSDYRSSNMGATNKNKKPGRKKGPKWNGIVGDLISGSADMAFAPLSVSRARAEVIDFSAPYFHSGVSLLAAPKTKSEIPLLAFLLPFSPELWIAIFTSLNITAIAVAVYEWLSPFGLNPWGRQRSKNFSISSALWVMWGLLCGHLVAFKAPKSWPNKFLINVWGGFSVIFVASYTANIAALIAGLFFHNAASSYDASLLTQRVGAPVASAAEYYVQNTDQYLWEHMKKYSLETLEDGIRGLKNGSLDLLMGDSPVLDYYRATDHGCRLQRIGETFVEDAYAIGMTKDFPLKDSISALIAKYSSNGYLDILTEKWYGGLPCFKFEADIVQPRPLGVAAVAGVFLLLGLGMVLGVIILIFEHWFYKYALPTLRLKPKGTVWKSRNIMFFSQKLYRFINCVELVSPHHAARELVHSIRQGQIASLFQKSIKRKEDEQRRRRKSKAQFFEMIQEIRRVQQNEKVNANLATVVEVDTSLEHQKSPPQVKPKVSPKPNIFSALRREGRSRSNSSVLSIRRFSTDSILGERLDSIGRRLSRDITASPPDLGRHFETFGKAASVNTKFDTENNKFETFGGKSGNKIDLPFKTKVTKRPALNFESYHRDSKSGFELPIVKEGLEPPIYQEDRSKAVLKAKLHRELTAKYGPKKSNDSLKSEKSTPPPLPKKPNRSPRVHIRHKSADGLDSDTNKSDDSLSMHKSSIRPRLPQMGKLSREDLLRLSHSSQSEIHEYLKNSMELDYQAQPP
ncbi:hypothetical protein HA402_014038 [Bradysia odoriphaga]|nr:hypothetical protein HA402_014038 [Bradysia odoriphaga]